MKEQHVSYHEGGNLSASELVEKLSNIGRHEGARLLRELIQEEQELSLLNLLKPYEDKVPQVLRIMDLESIVALFEELDDYYIMKALFGNFQAVDEEKRQGILEQLDREKVALLFSRMSIATEIASATDTASLVRLFREMPTADEERIIGSLIPEKAADLAWTILGAENAVRSARLATILEHLDHQTQQKILSKMEPEHARRVLARMQHPGTSEFDAIDSREAQRRIAEMSPGQAADELKKANPVITVEVLKLADVGKAAQVLTIIAQRDPRLAADLLEEVNEKIIIGFKGQGKQRSRVEEFYACPAVGILENMDLTLETRDVDPIVIYVASELVVLGGE